MTTHTYDFDDFAARYDLAGIAQFKETIGALPACTETGPWLAGGCVRRVLLGEKPDSDWDYFCRDEQQREQLRASLVAIGLKQTHSSDTAVSYSGAPHGYPQRQLKVQVIKLAFYADLSAVLESFDFTICQVGWDGSRMHAAPFALWDIARQRISVNKITFAASSVRRLLKYQKQGFNVCQGAIKTLLEAVAADPNVIHSEVEYVD